MLIHAGFFSQAPFSPTDNPANIAWVDAGDPASFTVTGSALTGVTNKGGTGSGVVTVFGAAQSGTRAQNGINIFDFDGVDDALNLNEIVNAGTLMFAMAAIVDTSTNNEETLFGIQQTERFRARAADSAGAFNFEILPPTGASVITPAGGYESVFRIFSITLNLTANTIEAFVDGTSVGSTNDYTTSVNNSANATLMANNNLNRFLDGGVGEFIATTDGSIADRQKTEGYLAHRWGVDGQLPAAHPYKASSP